MAHLQRRQTAFDATFSSSGIHSEGGGDVHRRRRHGLDHPQQPPPSALKTKKKVEATEVGDGYGRHEQEKPRQDALFCGVTDASNIPSEKNQHHQEEEEEEDHHHQQQQDWPRRPAPAMQRTKKKKEVTEVGDGYSHHGQEKPGPDALASSVCNASFTMSESLQHNHKEEEEEEDEEDHHHDQQDHPQQAPPSMLRMTKKREAMEVGSGCVRHEQEEPRPDTLLSNASNIPSESLQHHQEEKEIQCFPPPFGHHHHHHRLDHPQQHLPSMLRAKKRREATEVGDDYGQNAGQEVRSFGILHWGGGKRPRGSPPKHLEQSRIQTRSQHAAALPDSLRQALNEEKKAAVPCCAALDPCTHSPEDSSSRLVMRDGQDDATILSSQIPLNQATEFRRITVGRDQLISSSPRKNSKSLENDSPLILDSASQHSTMTILQMRREEISLRPRHTTNTFDLDSFEWPRIVITLSRKEKEDDFLIMKRSKLPQRPKRRTKATERAIRYCYLGNGLSNITRRRYEVREKKPIQKKSGGLKAMESEESDSNS